MSAQPNRTLLVVDAVGAALLGVCAIGCAYLTFFHGDHAAAEIRELTQGINASSQDLSLVRAARDRQRTTLKERHVELTSGRQLPANIPIEEYFQALSQLAAEHRLRVVRQNPLPPRQYPGLLEQRYAYEVSGTMPDLARFFKAVEDADLWADIAYLKISATEGPRPSSSSEGGDRVAVLTISLFSALRPEGGSTAGG